MTMFSGGPLDGQDVNFIAGFDEPAEVWVPDELGLRTVTPLYPTTEDAGDNPHRYTWNEQAGQYEHQGQQT